MPNKKNKKTDSFVVSIREVQPRTDNQKQYIESIQQKAITFCVGPAGGGKSFLSCYYAAKFFIEEKVDKIILCRPVIEAGEKLGYLPGNIEEKLDPYIRPLYDIFEYLLGKSTVNNLIEEGYIEIIPLAFMRGRTLHKSFVILDEAQNATDKQLFMFLTRMGKKSHFIINGDITQSDLEGKFSSGLKDAWVRLHDIEGIGFVELDKSDICRHPLVQKIVEAYE